MAFLIARHAVGALEHGFLDAAVRRDLDRVPDGEAVSRDVVMGLVDAPVDRQLHRLRLSGGAQAGCLGVDGRHRCQLKLD